MKREEKAQVSKERIMAAAMEEFGEKNYDLSSLNNICNDNAISKGLIYHYFGNKEELYLCCVQSCLDKFIEFLSEEVYDFTDFQIGMNQYLERRFLFFHTNPWEGRLFFNMVIQPPRQLERQIHVLKRDFDAQCLEYYKAALAHISLREGISQETALEYFVIFQELFNGYFQKHMVEETKLDSLIEVHEVQLAQFLNLMLYGIAKEDVI
ncbi:MAG: TetR/AcrR family transcriptional regulator [Lachnospiraceae bacterium]